MGAACLWALAAAGAFAQEQPASTSTPAPPRADQAAVLTRVAEVVAMDAAEARHSNRLARIRGVVTYQPRDYPWVYLHDGEIGVLIALRDMTLRYQAGQELEVEGTVGMGMWAPYIQSARERVLGHAKLPSPKRAEPARMEAGEEFANFVLVRGYIRDVAVGWGHLTLLLHDRWRLIHGQIRVPAGFHLPHDWLDAEVELSGVCWTREDSRGRAAGFQVFAAGPHQVRFLQPGRSNLFELPRMTLGTVLAEVTHQEARVRVSGVVTHVSALGQLYLEEEGTPAQALLLAPMHRGDPSGQYLDHPPHTPLSPGDRVEIVGAPRVQSRLLTLHDAQYRRLGTGPSPVPAEVTVDELMQNRHMGRLVRLKAELLDWETLRAGSTPIERLILQQGNRVLQATLENAAGQDLALRRGGHVQLTGVCVLDAGKWGQVHSVMLHLRDGTDLVPLPPPSFWTRPEFRITAMSVGAVAALAAIWIGLQHRRMNRLRASEESLERRVNERTAALRAANSRLHEEVAGRQQAEAVLRVALAAEKELNQMKSSFVSMVSHEFRTPLEVILSSSNILDHYLDRLTPDQRGAQLRAIQGSIRRMNDLVDEVLLLGRFDAGRMPCQPCPVDLQALCLQAVAESESAARRDGAIQFRADTLQGEARADAALVQHILTNLLGNALKYSAPSTPVTFTLRRAGDQAEFVIQDHGCGIPAGEIDRLFSAFYRGSNAGHTQGSGLGLVIVKRCVDLHGGSIDCQSIEGRGTTFTVRLPLFAETRVAPEPAVALTLTP